MKRLYVFADFDWLKAPRLIGELSYESLRGSDSYGFCYSDDWLRDYGNLFLSDDLNNYPGQQYTAVFHPLTILSESKTTPAWVVYALRNLWRENISMQVKFYGYHH